MGVLSVGGKVARRGVGFEPALRRMLGMLFLPEEVELLLLVFVMRMAFLLFQLVVGFLGLHAILGVLPCEAWNL